MKMKAPAQGAALATTWGARINLGPNEVREIPDAFVEIATRHGCVLVGDTEQPAAPATAEQPPAADTGGARLEAVRSAVKAMVDEGNPEDFRSDGQPRLPKVRDAVGFEVTAGEIADVYAELSAGEDQ